MKNGYGEITQQICRVGLWFLGSARNNLLMFLIFMGNWIVFTFLKQSIDLPMLLFHVREQEQLHVFCPVSVCSAGIY